MEVCNLLGDRAVINNLTVNNFSIQQLIDLDCQLSDCFVVDNRGLQYCDIFYTSIQDAVDAACVSGLARVVICVAPSDYPENLVIPSTCATELVIRGASNANETTTANAQIQGTVTVNAPVVFDNIRIDATSVGPVTALTVNSIAGAVPIPFCLLHDCDVTSTLSTPGAAVEVSSTGGAFTLLRVDNTRISNLPTDAGVGARRSVHLGPSNTAFIMTGDSNLRSNFASETTALSGVNGPLLVNSSLQGSLEQGSATAGIRGHDLRLTSLGGGLPAIILSVPIVAGTNPVNLTNGFINCFAAPPSGYVDTTGSGPLAPGDLILTGVTDLQNTTGAGGGFSYLIPGGVLATSGTTIDGPVFSLNNIPALGPGADNAAAMAAGVQIGGLYTKATGPPMATDSTAVFIRTL